MNTTPKRPIIPREERPSTPPEGMVPPLLPPFAGKSDRWLLEEAVRRSHHAWETAATADERVRRLAKSMDVRFEAVDRQIAQRTGSHPAIEEAGARFLQLQLDEEDSKVQHNRFLLAQDEQARRLAAQNRARAWSYAWKVAAVLFALISAYLGATGRR